VFGLTWGSLDGKTVLASAGVDGTARVWDPADGAPLRVLTGHTGWVWAVAWGIPDGNTVLASVSTDATVRLLDPKRFQEAVIRFENLLLMYLSARTGSGIAGLGWLPCSRSTSKHSPTLNGHQSSLPPLAGNDDEQRERTQPRSRQTTCHEPRHRPDNRA
jgi:WD40 repeat protein